MKSKPKASAFTLLEIMIAVAIIALLVVFAIPSYLRTRKRTQAGRILEDLHVLDGAIECYALETNKGPDCNPSFDDLKNYIKTDSVLYGCVGRDILGNSYGPFTVDSAPRVNATTRELLAEVTAPGFWSPYQ